MRIAAAFAAILAAIVPAAAAPAAEAFVGVAANGIHYFGANPCCFEGGPDIQFGVRSAPWFRFLNAEFRGHVFGAVNTAGGVDYAAAGASLRFTLPLTGLYFAPGIGAAIHDGSGLKYQATPDHLYLGNRVLIEPELSLGYHVAGPLAVELSYVHLSHARLGGHQNPGLNDLGVRGVVRF